MKVVALGPRHFSLVYVVVFMGLGGGKGGLTEVEKELYKHVDGEMGMRLQVPEVETPDDEQDGESDETHELHWFAADSVNRRHGAPVARDGTSADENARTSSEVVENVVGVASASVADGAEHSSGVEVEAVERDIEHEPRACRAEEDLAVLPLTVVVDEVLEACLGDGELRSFGHGLCAGDFVGVTLVFALHVGVNIVVGLFNIASNIEGVARSLGDGETVVESNAGGDGTEPWWMLASGKSREN
jgi:hypothetical protein